jgi:hypothetical protein
VLAKTLESEIVRALFLRSHFKRGQLDSLIVKRYAYTNGYSVKGVLSLKDRPASLGSLERSAAQAERVIEKSTATLILALSLGLLDYDVVSSIPKVSKAFEELGNRSVDDEQLNQLLGIVDAILRKSSHK